MGATVFAAMLAFCYGGLSQAGRDSGRHESAGYFGGLDVTAVVAAHGLTGDGRERGPGISFGNFPLVRRLPGAVFATGERLPVVGV